jgi:hypothetical protein
MWSVLIGGCNESARQQLGAKTEEVKIVTAIGEVRRRAEALDETD